MAASLPKIRFRALEYSDLPQLKEWRNGIIDMCREFRLINDEHQERWWKGYCEQAYLPYPKHLMFGIETLRETGITNMTEYSNGVIMGDFKTETSFIGVCGWTYIDWLNRRAELSIYIGDESLRHKGYGRAALRELHRIGFCELGFRAVWLEVHDWNPHARKLYETEGYKLVGKWRDARFKDGEWFPTWIYDLTAEEYFAQ